MVRDCRGCRRDAGGRDQLSVVIAQWLGWAAGPQGNVPSASRLITIDILLDNANQGP